MNKRTIIEKLNNTEITVGEMYDIHNYLYGLGMRLPLIHNSYIFVEKDKDNEPISYKTITRFRNSLQEGGFSGKLWLCPDYKILDKDIFSYEAEDYIAAIDTLIIEE